MRRITRWIFVILAFGILGYNLSVPWMREYSLSVYKALPKSGLLLIEAALIQVLAIGTIVLLRARRPAPYAWSLKTLLNMRRKRKEQGGGWSEAYASLSDEERFPEVNVNFAALEVSYLRMLFIPLIFMSLPFLATLEEMIFRNGKDTLVAVLLFSALFALAHVPSGFSVIDTLLSFGVGLIFALHYAVGGIGDAVILHTAINVMGVAILVMSKVFWPDYISQHVVHRSWYRKATSRLATDIGGA